MHMSEDQVHRISCVESDFPEKEDFLIFSTFYDMILYMSQCENSWIFQKLLF